MKKEVKIKAFPQEAVPKMLAWYEENKRTLAWREEPTPYRVWVSEIMLQQTRVEAVKSYYLRWMKHFPDVVSLAKAEEETVLKNWEGLGYYSRARNLLQAAKIVMNEYGGDLPCDVSELQKIPGIGAYTAGAICSIAFGKKEPAVDGNVLRVVSRVNAEAFDIRDTAVRRGVADVLRPLMPDGKTSDFTQALFEIGAMVCKPDDGYRCEDCPLRFCCVSYEKGEQSCYPVRPQKAEKKQKDMTVFLLEYRGKIAVRKRDNKGLLAGLYEFPNEEGFLSQQRVYEKFSACGVPLPDAKHVFTHIVWNMKGYKVELQHPLEGMFFVEKKDLLLSYPIPSAFAVYKKIALEI